MFDIGFQELIIIFIVALLVVGPEKIPEFSKTLGKWVVEIRKGIHSAKQQIEEEISRDTVSAGTAVQSLQEEDETDEIVSNHNMSGEKT